MSRTDAGPYPFAEDLQPPAAQVATPLPGFHVPMDVVFALGQGDVAQGVAMLQHFMLSPMSQARDWFPLLSRIRRARRQSSSRPRHAARF